MIPLPVACPGRGRTDMANGYGGGQVFALCTRDEQSSGRIG